MLINFLKAGKLVARPYTALPARVPLDEVNGKTAEGQEETVDLARVDAMDDAAFGALLWEEVTGRPYSQALEIVAEARARAVQLGESAR